jgi:NAD(P)-dependent dehydrogenase (short-subunit alcohol dehydrogenase family)
MELKGKWPSLPATPRASAGGTVLALARAGVDVVIADIHPQRMERTAAEVAEVGQKAIAIRCDVTSDADVDALAQTVRIRTH